MGKQLFGQALEVMAGHCPRDQLVGEGGADLMVTQKIQVVVKLSSILGCGVDFH